MRSFLYMLVVLIAVIVIFPTIIVKSCSMQNYNEAEMEQEIGQSEEQEEIGPLYVNLYITQTEKCEKILLEDYIKGVVAAEMPAEFELEALKAQAIAARTYAVNRLKELGNSGCPEHPQADLCDDYKSCQAWMSEKQLEDRWGKINFYKYWKKVSSAVDQTAGIIITYNSQPIDPLFHSTSGGKTENSEEVFSTKLPYLRSVISEGEEKAPKFVSKLTISRNDFVKKFNAKFPNSGINAKNVDNNLKILETSEGGRVKKIQIGKIQLKGTEFRSLYNLNSTNFDIHFSGNIMIITTIGYGHGVGMSQYGANSMAQKGKTYQDILKHYYNGVKIQNIKDIF